MADYYDGPHCYVGADQEGPDGQQLEGGWHYTVVQDENGFDVPGEKLVLEDTADGSASRFRLATKTDTESWHARKHQNFADFRLEDQSDGIRVSEDELTYLQTQLDEYRASKGGQG